FGMDSRDLNKNNRLLSKISYLHQRIVDKEDNLPLSVMDVVLSGYLSNSKNLIFRYSIEMYQNAEHLLKHFSLYELKDEKITNLSIGQRQRVFLAKALISNPDLLILDEPTVGIDKESNEAFYNYLKHLNEVHKITILLVSHDFSQAINFVNKVLYLGNKCIFLKPKEEAIDCLRNLQV
ncbi:MAG: ATP-binding cassette domain-containing protein, partial [Candidatus Anstonellales archaeon]